MLGDRLGRPWEAPVGLEVHPRDPASQPLEQRGHHHAAGAPYRVERHPEAAAADAPHVHRLEPQHRGEVACGRRVVGGDVAQRAEPRTLQPPVGRERHHLRPTLRIKKDAVGADELEGVPLDRVVARREDDAAGGAVVLDRELRRGRGDQPQVDHVAADRHEARRRGAREHRPGRASIPAQHDGGAAAGPLPRSPFTGRCPNPKRRRVARHGLRRQVFADDAPDAGDADHQGIRHGGNVGTAGGRVNMTRVRRVRRARRPPGGGAAGAPAWRWGAERRGRPARTPRRPRDRTGCFCRPGAR